MLMSKAEYARHCGVSRQTVYDWMKKGEVILSGAKIDVTATEQERAGGNHANNSPWPHRTMEMTWKQANDWVSQHDGEKPDEENHVDRLARIAAAAEELGYDVDGSAYDEQESVIALYMGGSVRHEFYDKGCVDAAITFLRTELLYVAFHVPDDEADWSPQGLSALCLRQGNTI
ncbi:DNA-binding protein [Pectobacterium aroidearum]|uniref:helix-turn-helix transcriptional regulator n=1 Tax=Pectobacterium aroidearum TaxID=1201031 RepID=UPI003306DA28